MSKQYYYSTDGSAQRGPVDKEALRAIRLSPKAMVWREGLTAWVEAHTLPELADLFAHPAPFQSPAPVAPMQSMPSAQTPGGYGAIQPLQASIPAANPPLGYQGPGPYYGAVGTNGLAVTSMIVGIVAVPIICIWWLSGILAILAVVFGHIAKSQIATTPQEGGGMATAGIVLGYIVLGIYASVILVALFIGAAASLR